MSSLGGIDSIASRARAISGTRRRDRSVFGSHARFAAPLNREQSSSFETIARETGAKEMWATSKPTSRVRTSDLGRRAHAVSGR